MSPSSAGLGLACRVGLALLLATALCACGGKRPAGLGAERGRLAPCPSSPNCVSSEAADQEHRVAALPLIGTAEEGWRAAREQVALLPRTRIVEESPGYLHAECRSRIFGFVDDLELLLAATEGGSIAVRSASRVGRSDLGVNHRRVESLRAALLAPR